MGKIKAFLGRFGKFFLYFLLATFVLSTFGIIAVYVAKGSAAVRAMLPAFLTGGA